MFSLEWFSTLIMIALFFSMILCLCTCRYIWDVVCRTQDDLKYKVSEAQLRQYVKEEIGKHE